MVRIQNLEVWNSNIDCLSNTLKFVYDKGRKLIAFIGGLEYRGVWFLSAVETKACAIFVLLIMISEEKDH